MHNINYKPRKKDNKNAYINPDKTSILPSPSENPEFYKNIKPIAEKENASLKNAKKTK